MNKINTFGFTFAPNLLWEIQVERERERKIVGECVLRVAQTDSYILIQQFVLNHPTIEFKMLMCDPTARDWSERLGQNR